MLNASRRLRLKRDFERVFIEQHSLNGRYFRLKVVATKTKVTRFAVVVSGKVNKRAVVRNRIRRRAWSIISQVSPNIPSGFDVVLIALPQSTTVGFDEIKGDVNYLLHKYFKAS